jgi:molybdopterin-biosynthesis enzyme MoeA-like protein
MATLPQGAHPLFNPVGTAPGVKLEHKGMLIYILPGVPAELKAIFDASIMPELHSRFELGVGVKQALIVHCDDEAEVAPYLREVTHRHPQVYLKSLAKPFPSASKQGLRVIAAASAESSDTAQRKVDLALADLQRVVTAAGMRVSLLPPTGDAEDELQVAS